VGIPSLWQKAQPKAPIIPGWWENESLFTISMLISTSVTLTESAQTSNLCTMRPATVPEAWLDPGALATLEGQRKLDAEMELGAKESPHLWYF